MVYFYSVGGTASTQPPVLLCEEVTVIFCQPDQPICGDFVSSGPNHHQTSISTFGVSSSRPSPGPPAAFPTFGSDPTMLSFPDSVPLPRLSFPPRHLSGVPEGGAQVQNGDEGDSIS